MNQEERSLGLTCSIEHEYDILSKCLARIHSPDEHPDDSVVAHGTFLLALVDVSILGGGKGRNHELFIECALGRALI